MIQYYYDLFEDKRKSVQKVLEIGIGDGTSLRMWRDFFPKATIYGADYNPARLIKEPRIESFLADQRRKEHLAALINKIGSDIDLVIDDGSHRPRDQVFTCINLMPLLKPGVTYVIEDVADPAIVERLNQYHKSYDNGLVVVKHKLMDQRKITMIVARYKENLDWLKKIPWKYVVYNKGDALPKWIENQVTLANTPMGREGHTYITFIVNNYQNLSDYTVFVQGNPFDHTKKLIRKIRDFYGESDFYDLADKHLRGRRGGKSHFELETSEEARKIFVDPVTDLRYGQGAQFIISKKAILSHPKILYQKLLELIVASEKENYFSAWMMERLWRTLFYHKHRTIYDPK